MKRQNKIKFNQNNNFWFKFLFGGNPVVNLPIDKARKYNLSYCEKTEEIELSDKLIKRIDIFCRQRAITLPSFLFCAFNLFIHRISGQNDVIILASINNIGDTQKEFCPILSFSSLPVRVSFKGNPSFLNFIKLVDKKLLEVFINRRLFSNNDLKKLFQSSSPEYSQIFNTIFKFTRLQGEKKFCDLDGKKNEFYQNPKHDLGLSVISTSKSLIYKFDYNVDVFSKERIKSLINLFLTLVDNILKTPISKIGNLKLLNQREENILINDYNKKRVILPRAKTIIDLFEEQVRSKPNFISIYQEGVSVSYKELNKKANQFARLLLSKGVKRKQIVGIFLDRSIETIISILAILKIGASYLPIDLKNPMERINYILRYTGVNFIVTSRKLVNQLLKNKKNKYILIDEVNFAINNYESGNFIYKPAHNNQALIIYTSGSTGKPKGVILTHESLICYIFSRINARVKSGNRFTENDIFAQSASFGFLLSVCQFFTPLVLGAKLIIYSDEITKNPALFMNKVNNDKITVLQLVPSYLSAYLESADNKTINIKEIELTGEQVSPALIRRFYSRYKTQLVTTYGSTEMSDICLRYIVPRKFIGENVLSGRPINKNVFILDQYKNIQPFGIIGELYVSGPGLSRGYLNQPDMTKRLFIANPFGNGVFCKTGDLAKMHPDGNIEILGRIDHQIKIRGNVIEPREIEENLIKVEKISNAVVVSHFALSRKEICLIVYYLTKNYKPLRTEKITKYLRTVLPDYMIPSHFVHLKQFPLNQNGKLDRKALPEPREVHLLRARYEPPQGPTEEKLVQIWQEVLGVKKVSRHDNFFDLGGHSLKAIRLLVKINQVCQTDFPLKKIFLHPVLSELAATLDQAKPTPQIIIPKAPKKEYYPLSHAQKRLWILYKLEKKSPFYNVVNVKEIKGLLDISCLKKAIYTLVSRHESLRTNFKEIKGEPFQYIKNYIRIRLKNIDLSGDIYANKKENAILREIANAIFNIEHDALIRFYLIKKRKDLYIFCVVLHHIITDGWSMDIFFSELQNCYKAYLSGQKPKPEQLVIQYKDYAVWEQSDEFKKRIKKQEKFWLDKFSGEIPELKLPVDFKRPEKPSYLGATERVVFNKNISNTLDELCRKLNISNFNLFLSCFIIFLHKISGQKKIITSFASADRQFTEIEKIVGFFINTLIINKTVDYDNSFLTFLENLKHEMIHVFSNKEYPFELLMQKLNPDRDLSKSQLINTMLIYDHYEKPFSRMADLKISSKYYPKNINKFDAKFRVKEIKKSKWIISCEYNKDIFCKKSVKKFLKIYIKIISDIINDPQIKIKNIEMIDDDEKKIYNNINDTKYSYPRDKTINQLIEEITKKFPDKVAVEFERKKINYRELELKVNNLSQYLLSLAIVRRYNVVSILADKNIEMVVAILAVMKIGKCCQLINGEFPKARLKSIFKNSNSGILLHTVKRKNFPKFINSIIAEDKLITNQNYDKYKFISQPSSPAFLIYTSGTTGMPKGIILSHRGIINNLYQRKKIALLGKNDVVAYRSPVEYVGSPLNILLPLVLGAKLIIYRNEITNDIYKLFCRLDREHITNIEIGPYLLFSYLEHIKKNKKAKLALKNLRTIFVPGAKTSSSLRKNFKKEYPEIKLIIIYGTSEYSFALSKEIKCFDEPNLNTEGSPGINTQVYICNNSLDIMPPGFVGELCVSGDGLFSGYLMNTQKTSMVFSKHPYIKKRILYRTGDQAILRPNGNVEILGRIDRQINVFGIRIEPGDVEYHLKKHKDIQSAIVMNLSKSANSEYFYVAYYTSKKYIPSVILKNFLKKKLPSYMIPTYFVFLKEFPLNRNGKLDYGAFPTPTEIYLTKEKHNPPRGKIEIDIKKLWEDILKVKKISRSDNFFDLGGHSLLAIRMISRINRHFEINLSLKDVFSFPQLSKLAQAVLKAKPSPQVSIKPAPNLDFYPLSRIQKLIWSGYRLDPNSPQYNIISIKEFKGDLDTPSFNKANEFLISRHETLRTNFREINGKPAQFIHDKQINKIKFIDFSHLGKNNKKEIINRLIMKEQSRPFKLESEKLIRMFLLKVAEKKHIFFIVRHHIITDKWSLDIFYKEMSEIYNAIIKGREPKLINSPINYKDYAYWEYSNDPKLINK